VPAWLDAPVDRGFGWFVGVSNTQPVVIMIAGPSGSGKTTFARVYLPSVGVRCFVNADLIAAGLSPLEPERAAIQAGKLMLQQIDERIAAGESFGMETTLSGSNYARRIPQWQAKGFSVQLVFLSLPSAELAARRVRARVAQGGHDIPEDVIRRRFAAGIRLFESTYKKLVDRWVLYDNSGASPVVLESSP
jgi:predicted ABC-type ATPase